MRISGGVLRGRQLHAPKTNTIRPMRDQVRAAVFNILEEVIEGSRFLDLFAGTGSVGIEALSRGAAEAVFVDQSPEALGIIRSNLKELDLGAKSTVIPDDVFRALDALAGQNQRFDLIFVGPPYGKGLADRTMQKLSSSALVHSQSIVFVEVFKKEILHREYNLLKSFDERFYGDNLVLFFQQKEPS
ncbi:16S rRNA (guanine(966)-N(2))-methyltransferase RsmD [Candidatus Acetothermia bacterium]|nr:16S rRNA (guanine(966)-N(2))-methyltransferase RsmD [Candidatus Acetothermia bacterium]MBI3644111.1 16S rRNA (guanine(966)-N(2))-methyltransferase RsmD [Candidatus Acetothermia bacterium]